MTTIVYRARVLAGDTRVTENTTILPEVCRKIFRLKDGSLFGAAGDAEEGELLLQAMLHRRALPKVEDKETEAVHVRVDGSVWLFQGLLWTRSRSPYVALGSGANNALGALAMGATAYQAVKVGCALDAYSGEPIQTLRLTTRKH